MTIVWTIGGLAALGGVGYLTYRMSRAQLAAPQTAPALGGGTPQPTPQTHDVSPQPAPTPAPTPAPAPTPQGNEPPAPPPSPPAVAPTRIDRARTTPAAQFLTVTHREESLTPEQLSNWVAAVKVVAMYHRGRDAASRRAPTLTGEFRHDIGVFQHGGWGRNAIRDGDRAGRLDVITQDGIRRELAAAQSALATGDWDRAWLT